MADYVVYNWDSVIDLVDPDEYPVLPEGDYDFEVVKVDRKEYQGKSEKIPYGCPIAVVSLRCSNGVEDVTINDNLYLYSNNIRRLSSFLMSVGFAFAKQKGININMIFQSEGLKGRCHVVQNKGTKGDTIFNNVTRYYPSNESEKMKTEAAQFTPTNETPPAAFTSAPQQQTMWGTAWGKKK